MEPKKAPNAHLPKSFQDSLKMGGLGGLSIPRQAPIRAGDRKSYHSNLQEELKFFVVGHILVGVRWRQKGRTKAAQNPQKGNQQIQRDPRKRGSGAVLRPH
jgi:hypothetical protein